MINKLIKNLSNLKMPSRNKFLGEMVGDLHLGLTTLPCQ